MEEGLRRAALAAIGFMPDEEGLALHRAGEAASSGPYLEIGSYCGRSAIYLGAAARSKGTILFSVDHHRGSEEHQPGQGYCDERLLDGEGRVDTLPIFARTISEAGLRDVVLGIAADSAALAGEWKVPLGLLFIDGSHSRAAAHSDYEGWTVHLRDDGLLCIHDVFPDPSAGGRPPFEIYERALDDGFEEISATGSLRVLRR